MDVLHGVQNIGGKIPFPIVAVGNFDGIHLGHQAIMKAVVERAKRTGGTGVVLTFEPHPLKILQPQLSLKLLTSFDEKTQLLEAMGIEKIICLEFSEAFSRQTPFDFAKRILYDAVGVKEVCIGWDFAFGREREGKAGDLVKMGEDLSFTVSIFEPVYLDGMVVSSSRVREHLQKGEVDQAARCLGRFYSMEGPVTLGTQKGRQLGFPTANLLPTEKMMPREGVYAVRVLSGGKSLKGAAYIGTRPTFSSKEVTVEVHLLDYQEDLYQKRLRIDFVQRIRDERKFENEGDLARQIESDIRETRTFLRET